MVNASVRDDVALESLVAQVADEFLDRQRRGERPTAEEYTARHPEAAVLLRKVLASLEVIGLSASVGEPGASATGDSGAEAVTGTLGDYRILGEIGRGGMGVVYEAEQISLGRKVALKVLPFAATMDKRQLQRFLNEARAAAWLRHPHIVPVYAVGCTRGVNYYAMQFIDGQSLEAMLQTMRDDKPPAPPPDTDATVAQPRPSGSPSPLRGEGRVGGAAKSGDTLQAHNSTLKSSKRGRDDWRRVAELAVQVAEALEHAHQSGVIHRDVKPANLMLDENGDLWVTDFGLAQVQTDTRLTMTGDLVGTLRYMSPEQALAKRVIVDHRTDIYSLGATFYEMLTLQPVFAGQDRQELLRQIAFEEAVAPRKLNRAIPVELETVILKALEKNPADRYGSAKEMADDLKRYLNDEPTLARRPTLWKRGRKWGERHVAAVRAGAAALLVIVAVVAATAGWWMRDQAAREVETRRAVSAALDESARWQSERKLPEALGAAKRAAATLASGAGTPALEQQVVKRLADLKFVAELEDIRAERDAERTQDQVIDFARCDRQYTGAFRAFGIDVDSLSPEQAASLLRERTVAVDVAAALDDWSYVVKRAKPVNEARWKRLVSVALAADPNPGRRPVREALIKGDAKALKALLTELPVQELPPATLFVLARAFEMSGDSDESLKLLREAQRRHPTDYWITSQLALQLRNQQLPQHQEALRFATAAVALRPGSAAAHFELGFNLSGMSRLDDAIASYREAIRLKPDYPFAHNNLGVALAGNKNFDDAIAAYREAIRLKPDYAFAHYNLGVALADNKKFDDAIVAYREAIRLKPNYVPAHNNLGGALADNKKFDDAIAAYREAIRLKPDYALAYRNLGSALISKKQTEEAIAAFQEAIRLNPNDANAPYTMGNALREKGKLVEAIVAYREAIRLKPDFGEAHNNLGLALKKNKMVDAAIAAFRESARLMPDSEVPYGNLGDALREKGKLDDAIAAYRAEIRLKPDYASAHNRLGIALVDNKKMDEAIAAFHEAIRLKPDDASAHTNLGLALMKKRQFDEAIVAYREATRLKPDNALAYTNLGVALQEKGRTDEAIAAFQEAIRLTPDYAVAHDNLDKALRSRGLDYAIAFYQEDSRLKPDSADAYNRLGNALRANSQAEDAIAAYRKAVSIKKDFPMAWNNLVGALCNNGEMEQAVAAYRDAISHHSDTAQLHNTLAWRLVSNQDVSLRDYNQALESATKAAKLSPKDGNILNTLGMALYRNDKLESAVEKLNQAVDWRKQHRVNNQDGVFFLAMAHWQLGDEYQAREDYEKAVQWMTTEKSLPANLVAELERWRAEAAELLEIEDANPKGKN